MARHVRGRETKSMKKGPPPANIDKYLAGLSDERRAALQRLRKLIHAAAPRLEECISYGIPAFRLDGRMVLAFFSASRHLSFFPGAHPVRAYRVELRAYETSKGTVRFTVEKPLPAALVRKLVKSRVAERAAKPTAKPRRR